MGKSFMKNTAVMFAAMFISKGLGAVLKIPLGNILGGEGMCYFTTAYSIFTPVLSFACAGIPTILTRNVAEYAACGEYGKIRAERRCSLLLALMIGLAGAALICIAAVPFVCYIADSPESLPGVLLIAPATVFCSVTAVYRGYYEGMSDAVPTAASQVIESVVKAALGVGLSYFVYANGVRFFGSQQAALPYSAAAAILGVTVSELCGAFYLLLRSRRKADIRPLSGNKLSMGEIYDICRRIFLKALPVSFGAAASNLLSLADMFTISNCVNISRSIFPSQWAQSESLSELMAGTSDPGNFLYGCYAGIVMSVYMLAAAASGVVARCAFPRLAAAVGCGSKARIDSEIKLLIKGTAVVTAPLTVFMAVFSEQILDILYPVRRTEVMFCTPALAVLSAGGIAAALLGAVCAVFNSYGDFGFPIRITLIGGAVKLFLNVLFIIVPQLNITGASLSLVMSSAICLIYASAAAKKRFGLDMRFMAYSAPAVSGALTGGVGAFLFHRGLVNSAGEFTALLISVALGGVMYVMMLLITDSGEFIRVMKMLRGKVLPARKST